MLTLTEKARDHLNHLLEKSGITTPDRGIRIGIKAGGCSGFEYHVEPAASQAKLDKIIVLLGVRIFIDPKSLSVMIGTEIDYVDYSENLLIKHQLVFKNPQAESSCGCGTSFQLKEQPKPK